MKKRLIYASDGAFTVLLQNNGNNFLNEIIKYVANNNSFYGELTEDEKQQLITKLNSAFKDSNFANFSDDNIKKLEPLFNILKSSSEWNDMKQKDGFQILNQRLNEMNNTNTNTEEKDLMSDANKIQASQYYNIPKDNITSQLMDDFAKVHADKIQ